MNSAPVYLISHFFFHIFEFLRHWYLNSFIVIGRWLMNNLEWLDRMLALRVTLRHFFEPLYGDYTIVGRLLGFIFRTIRITLALCMYPVLIAAAIAAYLIWIIIPPFLAIHVIYPTLWLSNIESFFEDFLLLIW